MAIDLGTFQLTRKSRAGVKAKDSKRAKQNGIRAGLASFRKTPRRKMMMTASATLRNLSLSIGILPPLIIIPKTAGKGNGADPAAGVSAAAILFF